MITMQMECAIGVEPMKSTLCRREPWPLGYAHEKLPGMDSNHHAACFRGRWATDYPTRQGGSAREDSNLRPRGSKPLTLTRLRYSPRSGGVGRRNCSHVAARAK